MLFSQIALSANLTLIFVLAVISALLILVQVKNKIFLRAVNLTAWFIFYAVLFFWVKYAFFLKNAGALYYGGGESYWQVTFQSLIETIFFRNKILDVFVVLLFIVLCGYWIFLCASKKEGILLSRPYFLSVLTLISIITTFYLLKVFLNVNYPEDRTGLFFYILFVLSLAFLVDDLNSKVQLVFLSVPLMFSFHFLANFNLSVHCWRIYETMPASFYKILLQEQQQQPRRITIGGHRVREFIYGFLNYNSDQKLNHMTSPEALQMNCDYALAYDVDKPYYEKYYSELAAENKWGFRLLKRRVPAVRKSLLESADKQIEGNGEYFNFFEVRDTSFANQNPLLLEVDLNPNQVPVPFNGWLVLQVDAGNEADNVFVRVPLNLIWYNWNGKNEKLSVVTGNIPAKIKRLVAYLWNIDKTPINIKINSAVIYQLEGKGVTEISKAKI